MAASVELDPQSVIRHVLSHLADDLTTKAIAARFGLSEHALHRRFRSATGTTIARFVERVRLEHAAHALLFHDTSIIDTAIEHGYQSHETFTRAFQRHFACAPRDFRLSGRWQPPQSRQPSRDRQQPAALSASRLQLLRPVSVVSLRHMGPYENVPIELWQRLQDWLQSERIPHGKLLALAWDSPQNTNPDELRFDAAIVANPPKPPPTPFSHNQLPNGWFAAASHIGAYADLSAAYPQIYLQAGELPHCRVIGLPVIEVYHTDQMQSAQRLNHTEIYVPVERRESHPLSEG